MNELTLTLHYIIHEPGGAFVGRVLVAIDLLLFECPIRQLL